MASTVTDRRLRSLDGLRGIAAAIVLLHHAALLNASISNVYLAPSAPLSPLAVVMTRTPLQLLTSGEEAVLVFFVLSGLVVALPAVDHGSFSWTAYYPRRLLRIMLPVAASVILAALLALASLHQPSQATSSWAGIFSFASLDWRQLLRTVDLFTGEVAINNPLWSLRYEILFSILLPVYIVLAQLVAHRWRVVLAASGALMLLGYVIADDDLRYLPIFLFGAMLAVYLDQVRSRVGRHLINRWWLGGIALVGALVLLEARWILRALHPSSTSLDGIGLTFAAYGAVGIVLLAFAWPPAVRFLETRFVQWLGRISFSLYLVHVPILLATSWWLHDLPWWVGALAGMPLAVGVAVLFTRFIERPAHRLSRRSGQAVARRLGEERVDGLG